MISKLRFSLIAVIMLVLLGFGFQNQAKGQIGLDGLFCPAVPHTTGWLETEIVGSGLFVVPDFTGALIGTVESVGGDNVGGLDWHHVDFTSFATPTPTNETGSQLVSWWTLKDTRNTYLQVTNSDSNSVTVHVRIHNEDCVEIRDFCDTYTPNDTHEYNFSDLVTNQGQSTVIPGAGNVEGWVVVTAVEDCGTDSEQAIEHNALSGQLIVHDSDDYLYGVNTYARQAVCFDIVTPIEVNLVQNGSFETGALAPWFVKQGNAGVIAADGISPAVQPPDGDFQAFLASSNVAPSGPYPGIFIFENATDMLINTGNVETNVSVIESAIFATDSSNTATYDLSFLAPSDAFVLGCDNYAAALLYDIGPFPAVVVDAECYNNFGTGFINTTGGAVGCTVATDDNLAYSISPFSFDGGKSNNFAGSLSIPGPGSYAIQFVTGNSTALGCDGAGIIFNGTNGALVDDVEVLDTIDEFDNCDGRLTGAVNAMLDIVRPDTLAAQFNILPGNNSAGADVVHINFADDYGTDGLGPYRPIAAFSAVSVSIFDDIENELSCGDALVCFARLGVDDALVNSDDFSPVTPTPTPTITPSITPTPPTLGPTATPTGSGGGGSSSCSIAASPVQLGTALANVLIPLVPVAFAFGVRAVRRRKK